VVSLPTAVLPDHAAVDASDTEEPAGQVAVGPSAAQPPVIEVESPLDSGQDQAVTQRPVAGVGTAVDRYYQAFASYRKQHDAFPDGEQLAQWLWHEFGVKGRSGVPLTAGHLRRYLRDFRERWQSEEQEGHTFA
jgi:hypothetical protein